MISVSVGHIIMTPIKPVGSGWPQRGSNPEPTHPELRAVPTEPPPFPPPLFFEGGREREREREREKERERKKERGGGGGIPTSYCQQPGQSK